MSKVFEIKYKNKSDIFVKFVYGTYNDELYITKK